MRYAARMDHSVWMLRICMFRRILMWPPVSEEARARIEATDREITRLDLALSALD
jgi:hypothetical protein